MIDPMAGLDGSPQGDVPADAQNSKEVFDVVALQRNMQRMDKIRSVMGIASGCVSGIIGLTGLEGLASFVFLHVSVCVLIWSLKMNFRLNAYTKMTWWTYLTGGLQQYALSFTLFWTLFYGLVYLY